MGLCGTGGQETIHDAQVSLEDSQSFLRREIRQGNEGQEAVLNLCGHYRTIAHLGLWLLTLLREPWRAP